MLSKMKIKYKINLHLLLHYRLIKIDEKLINSQRLYCPTIEKLRSGRILRRRPGHFFWRLTRAAPVRHWLERARQGRRRPRVAAAALGTCDEALPSPAQAVPAQGPAAAQSDHEHEPRAGLCRGRPSGAALPAVPRGKSEGRDRAHHDRRLGGGCPGLAARIRQSAAVRRAHRGRSPGPRRKRARARRSCHVPDHSPRTPHLLEPGRLAAGAGPLAGARASPSLVPQGDGGA
jgi:hypothetical protein